jgi:tetratricopeptide (TPR) repeat protein
VNGRSFRLPRAASLLLAAALAVSGASAALAGDNAPAARAAEPDMDSVRALLRSGDRARALEAAKTLLAAYPADVEANILYQDAARGQMPVNVLQSDYRSRWEAKKAGDTGFLLARTLPPADADKILQEALRVDGKSYWAQVGVAETAIRQGKAAPAEAAALAALELQAADPRAAARAGAQCAAARRFASAEACFRRSLAADGKSDGARLGLAHALLRQEKFDDAAAVLSELKATSRNPDTRVLLLEAAVAAEKGDVAAAEKALVQATGLSPGDKDAAMQLALLRLKKAEAAPRPAGKAVDPKTVAAEVAALVKAVAALPERAEFHYALGFAREITGEVDAALTEFREASRLDPLDGDVIVAIGAILVGKGLLEEAAAEFDRALTRDPNDAGALYQAGYVLEQQGKTKEAIPVYQRLVKAAPDGSRGWHALGIALDAGGRTREAAAALQKALDLEETQPRHHRDLGEAQYDVKGYERAEQILTKAVEMDPKDDTSWKALARTRTKQKKWEKAVEAYEKAAELLDKDATDVHLVLGCIYHEYLKNYTKAIFHYDKYIAKGGDAGDVEDWLDEAKAELEKKK